MVIGLANVSWIFFACNLMGAISTYFFIPKTKNRDADVIDFEEWQDAQAKEKGVKAKIWQLIARF